MSLNSSKRVLFAVFGVSIPMVLGPGLQFSHAQEAEAMATDEAMVTVETYMLEDTNVTGDAILTVTGLIEAGADQIAFDIEGFDALPQTSFETSTIWTDDTHTYTGVALADFVEILGASGETIVATAINDYAVEIPLTDAVEGGPIIASRLDGEHMSVRDKGPLWLIYPFDDDSDYKSEQYYARSIWQMSAIEFK